MDLEVGGPEVLQHLVDHDVVLLVGGSLERARHGLLERLLVLDVVVEMGGAGLIEDALGHHVEAGATLVGAAEPPQRDVVLLLDALGSSLVAVELALLLLLVGATLLGSRLGVGFISQLRRSSSKNDKANCFASGDPICRLYHKYIK